MVITLSLALHLLRIKRNSIFHVSFKNNLTPSRVI